MVLETKEGLKILKGEGGQELLFIHSDRLSECMNYLYNNNLRYIIISSFQGYKTKNINFVEQLADFLEGLTVLETYFPYSVINKLNRLRFLSIPDNGKDVIDLKNFPNIENCGVTFSARLKGLESCVNLKSLSITNYKSKSKDLSTLPILPSLEQLSLIKTDIQNLQGIERFSNLKAFELFMASKLEKITSLQALSKSLEEIQIEQAKKIHDYEILGKLTSLRKIILSDSGEIKSLAFVKSLPNLEFISFGGTKVLDGNISYCKGINFVGFDNMRHYTHKYEDFNK